MSPFGKSEMSLYVSLSLTDEALPFMGVRVGVGSLVAASL